LTLVFGPDILQLLHTNRILTSNAKMQFLQENNLVLRKPKDMTGLHDRLISTISQNLTEVWSIYITYYDPLVGLIC